LCTEARFQLVPSAHYGRTPADLHLLLRTLPRRPGNFLFVRFHTFVGYRLEQAIIPAWVLFLQLLEAFGLILWWVKPPNSSIWLHPDRREAYRHIQDEVVKWPFQCYHQGMYKGQSRSVRDHGPDVLGHSFSP
jgi:hypothetical protein